MRLPCVVGLVVTWAWAFASQPVQAQVGPPMQIQCNQFTQGTGTGQIATAATNKSIMICGWDVESTVAAGAFALTYGTGTTCGTNTTAVSPGYSALPAGTTIVDHLEFAGIAIPGGTNLCVTTATSVNYVIYWGQY